MKKKSTRPPVCPAQGEEDIREYAYHLYQQSGCQPGHDLDNWLEAAACLKANIPMHRSRTRVHWQINESEMDELCAVSPEAKNLAS